MNATTAQTPVDEFLHRLIAQHSQLSRQLKIIGTYIEQHRDHVGLERVQDLADHCGVQPSAVVRFAKHFGFSGFSEMQALFRAGLSNQIAPSRSYQHRIREAVARSNQPLGSSDISHAFVGGALAGLQELQQHLPSLPIERAVALLARAKSLWIVGARRAFPVATYLAYALEHTHKPVHLLDFVGAMHMGQLRGLRSSDVMVAISFAPYAEETMALVDQATQAGVKVIAITDSRMSLLAQSADIVLAVQESEVFGFRALSSTMALAQCLFVSLAYKMELEYPPGEASAR